MRPPCGVEALIFVSYRACYDDNPFFPSPPPTHGTPPHNTHTHVRSHRSTGRDPRRLFVGDKKQRGIEKGKRQRVRAREESLQQQKREKKGALAFLVALSFYARSHCNSLFPYELSNLGWPMLRVRRV